MTSRLGPSSSNPTAAMASHATLSQQSGLALPPHSARDSNQLLSSRQTRRRQRPKLNAEENPRLVKEMREKEKQKWDDYFEGIKDHLVEKKEQIKQHDEKRVEKQLRYFKLQVHERARMKVDQHLMKQSDLELARMSLPKTERLYQRLQREDTDEQIIENLRAKQLAKSRTYLATA